MCSPQNHSGEKEKRRKVSLWVMKQSRWKPSTKFCLCCPVSLRPQRQCLSKGCYLPFPISCNLWAIFCLEFSDIMSGSSRQHSPLPLMHLRISCWLGLHFPVLFVLYIHALLRHRVISGRTRHLLCSTALVVVI